MAAQRDERLGIAQETRRAGLHPGHNRPKSKRVEAMYQRHDFFDDGRGQHGQFLSSALTATQITARCTASTCQPKAT